MSQAIECNKFLLLLNPAQKCTDIQKYLFLRNSAIVFVIRKVVQKYFNKICIYEFARTLQFSRKTLQ